LKQTKKEKDGGAEKTEREKKSILPFSRNAPFKNRLLVEQAVRQTPKPTPQNKYCRRGFVIKGGTSSGPLSRGNKPPRDHADIKGHHNQDN